MASQASHVVSYLNAPDRCSRAVTSIERRSLMTKTTVHLLCSQSLSLNIVCLIGELFRCFSLEPSYKSFAFLFGAITAAVLSWHTPTLQESPTCKGAVHQIGTLFQVHSTQDGHTYFNGHLHWARTSLSDAGFQTAGNLPVSKNRINT